MLEKKIRANYTIDRIKNKQKCVSKENKKKKAGKLPFPAFYTLIVDITYIVLQQPRIQLHH